MTLLELITKASADPKTAVESQSKYPIILNPEEALLSLKSQLEENPDPTALVKPITGFQISNTDAEIIQSAQKFHKELKIKVKNTNDFSTGDFIKLLNSYYEKIGQKVGISIGFRRSDKRYTSSLIKKLRFLMGRDVARLVLEACVNLEIWEVLKTLIEHGLVEYSCYSYLVTSLVGKKKSDLLCVCIKHFSDLQSSDLLCILKYFLSPPKDAYSSMVEVKKEWESQALLAIKKAADKSLNAAGAQIAKEASILLMIAYDGFSVSELCLHYLIASVNLDELILTYAISKLNGSEIMGLIRYLGKWLKKYERFPQAGPCPKGSLIFRLEACEWVPTLQNIVKCTELVLDEHYASLVLHPKFHDGLRYLQGVVIALASEARLCCSMANVAEYLKKEVKEVETKVVDEDTEDDNDEKIPQKSEMGKEDKMEEDTHEDTPQKTDGKKSGGDKVAQTPISGGRVACKSCNRSFKSDGDLESHTKDKHEMGKEDKMEEDTRKTDGKKSGDDKVAQTPISGGRVACKSCNKSFKSDGALESHTKDKHEMGREYKMEEDTPQKTGGKKSGGDKVAQTPISGGRVACKSCNKSFKSDGDLESHTKDKHEMGKEDKMEKDTPQKTDGKKSGGDKVAQTSISGGRVTCKSCNKSFKSDGDLESHTKDKHEMGKEDKMEEDTPRKTDGKKSGSDKVAQTPISSGSVACKSCNKSFKSDGALESHTKDKHGGDK